MLETTAAAAAEHHINEPTERVAVCICSRRGPAMLRRCLNSLAAQTVPHGIEPYLIVIDNDAGMGARPIVNDFRNRCPLPVRYAHVAQPGIAASRNMALLAATLHGAAWICMIDDDEVAAPDWLSMLMAPAFRRVLAGRHELVPPDPVPFWYDAEPTAETANVRFSTALIRAGLRFDETIGLDGGEDQLFFNAARAAGFPIRRTERAVTFEAVQPERATFWGQVWRAYACAVVDMQLATLERGWLRVICSRTHTIPLNAIVGAIEMLISPVCGLAGIAHFKRRALGGARKLARAAGRLAAIVRGLPAARGCGAIVGCVMLIALAAGAPDTRAAPRAEAPAAVVMLTRDMSATEVDGEIRRAMPFPIVSIFSGVKDDLRHFAVNLRISGKSQPVFNVTWHVPIWADRAHMLRGIAAAAAYARVAADRLE